MMTITTLSPERLEALAGKLDRVLAGDHPTFTRQDADDLHRLRGFVAVFNGDPRELKEMQEFWLAGKGFLKFGKWGFYFAAALAAFIINWDRLMDIFTGPRP